MHKLTAVIIALGFSPLAVLAQAPQEAPQQNGAPVHDLGDRVQNQTYPLQLTAQNLDCKSPQDFRFDLSAAPWVVALEDPIVRQVPPSASKSVSAMLDFNGAEIGPQQGVVSTICETCGYIPFVKNCRADKRDVILQVNVTPAPTSAPAQGQIADASDDAAAAPANEDSGQPNAQASASEGVDVEPSASVATEPALVAYEMSPQLDPELDPHLKPGERAKLNAAREKVVANAVAAGEAAEALRNALKKKKDCEDDLAALKAALDQAQRDADAAQTAADAAQDALDNGPEAKAVEDAQKAVDNFQKDVDTAQREYDRWKEAAQGQQNYLELVIEEEGNLDSPRGKNAKEYYEDADAKRAAAKAALETTKNSMAARTAALAAAKNAKAAAQRAVDNGPKKAAADAAAKVQAMKDKLNEKEKECLGLEDAAKKRAHTAGVAQYEADQAKKAAKKSEKAAKAQALDNLKDEIKRKKKDCDAIKKMWDEHFKRQSNAMKALYQSGYYKRKEGAKKPKEPSSIWNDYKKLGYDTFVELAAQSAEMALPGGVPTLGNVRMLFDILEAAYRIAGIVQSAYTPDTYMHGRTEGQALRDWLVSNNFADASPGDKDAREVENQMRRLKDPSVVAKDMAQAIRQMEECKRELAALRAKLKAAGK